MENEETNFFFKKKLRQNEKGENKAKHAGFGESILGARLI